MIFLSHSSKDKDFVKKLNLSFMSYGLRTFLDDRDISVGDSIPKRIYESIDQSSHLIYVVSQSSIESNWVTEELSVAKMKQLSSDGITILPALIEHTELPSSISHIKYADFTEWENHFSYELAFQQLLKPIKSLIQPIGINEVNWYVINSEKLKECIHWMTRNIFEINGGLSAGDHYMPTKMAFEDQQMIGDLAVIISLMPRELHAVEDKNLIELFANAVNALTFAQNELDLGAKHKISDRSKVDKFRVLADKVLNSLEEIRNRSESTILKNWGADKPNKQKQSDA
ncbi:MAG: toll/interleukin-1 receptor domain-containing protein [Halopseudomonas sp.]